MRMLVIPVTNGVIPRASSNLTGIFVDHWSKRVLSSIRPKQMILLLPYVPEEGLYPVGAGVSVTEIWTQEVMVASSLRIKKALFVNVKGKGTFKATTFSVENGIIYSHDAELMDLKEMRKKYPVIDGAGWTPTEGSTQSRSKNDIRVEIYGVSHEGQNVKIGANLGKIVTPEQAHTIEHAIIRSLSTYALVTPKTLRKAIAEEACDLKTSLEIGYRFKMPEYFGVTPTGYCGNPLTGLAHFYLTEQLVKNLREGQSLPRSILNARLKTLSLVTEDLELTTSNKARVFQSLKYGMMHEDSVLPLETLKTVLKHFPISPWA